MILIGSFTFLKVIKELRLTSLQFYLSELCLNVGEYSQRCAVFLYFSSEPTCCFSYFVISSLNLYS